MRGIAYLAVAASALVLVGCSSTPEDTPAAAEKPSITEAPNIAHWSSMNGVLVPIGETDGPTSALWEPLTGFSHTPQGAALAAIGQSVQLSTASDKSWSKILSVVAAPGEARDAYAVQRAQISSTGTVDPDVVPTILGYTFEQYSPDEAAVDVVQRFPDDSLAATRTDVVWTGADWKLDLPTAETAVGATALTELPADMVALEGPH